MGRVSLETNNKRTAPLFSLLLAASDLSPSHLSIHAHLVLSVFFFFFFSFFFCPFFFLLLVFFFIFIFFFFVVLLSCRLSSFLSPLKSLEVHRNRAGAADERGRLPSPFFSYSEGPSPVVRPPFSSSSSISCCSWPSPSSRHVSLRFSNTSIGIYLHTCTSIQQIHPDICMNMYEYVRIGASMVSCRYLSSCVYLSFLFT